MCAIITPMKFKHAPLAAFLCTSLLAGACVGKAGEQPRRESRVVVRRAAVEEQRKSFWYNSAFRPTMDRPCDSTACRPQRFAWSPTAPGA